MDSFKPMQEERKCKEFCLQMRRGNLPFSQIPDPRKQEFEVLIL